MSENTLPAQHQPSLADVIKKIRNTDFPYAVNEKWDETECNNFINKCFEQQEQSNLLNASAKDLYDALINTQPQTIDWSFDNPYIRWPLAASLCVAGATCIASPCIAVPSIITSDTAGMLVTLGVASCMSSFPICIHESDIQEYTDHGIDANRTYTVRKEIELDRLAREHPLGNFDKYRGQTIKNYKDQHIAISPSHFIRIIKDLSSCRIHTEDDKKTLMDILTVLTYLRQKPELSQNNNYNNEIENINNKNEIDLADGNNKSKSKND